MELLERIATGLVLSAITDMMLLQFWHFFIEMSEHNIAVSVK